MHMSLDWFFIVLFIINNIIEIACVGGFAWLLWKTLK